MPILDKANLDNLTGKFESQLNSPVYLRLFTQNNSELIIPDRKCDTCLTTEKILTAISSISDKLNLEIIDIYKTTDESSDLKINRIPATIIGQTGRPCTKTPSASTASPSFFIATPLLESLMDLPTC